jgi:hypothetical protein
MPTNRRRRRHDRREIALADLSVGERHAIEQGFAPRWPYYRIRDLDHLRHLWQEFGQEILLSRPDAPALAVFGPPK